MLVSLSPRFPRRKANPRRRRRSLSALFLIRGWRRRSMTVLTGPSNRDPTHGASFELSGVDEVF